MTRLFDLALSSLALLLLTPLLAILALAVLIDSGLPVFFRQTRLGRGGRPFRLLKFRSMRIAPESDRRVSAAGDSRVTRIGRLLRRSKLDELPQLINILRGDMSFVGPRPELPVFVEPADATWRAVLSVKPGLIDPASLAWTDEAGALARYADPAAAYRQVILPQKLAASRAYLRGRTFAKDMQLLVSAIWRALRLRL